MLISTKARCDELIDLPSPFIRIDLIELTKRPLNELLEDAKRLYESMRVFEKQCIDSPSRNVYDLIISMYHLALLKLSAALHDRLKDSRIEDEFIQFILNYYTPDEREALRELERFSKLDVIGKEKLADIIVAEEGEIYRLVKEAVVKGYIDLGKVLKTWESELKIRNFLTQAFIQVYHARFNNIIDAIKLLLDQQPGWLKRLFREYEKAILESAEVRKSFEERFKRVFDEERTKLEEVLRKLEEENNELRSRIERLTVELALAEGEKRKHDEELSKIMAQYESLIRNYESIVKAYNEKVSELETLKKTLVEKERELEALRSSHESSRFERIALENEIVQLRKTIAEYEKRLMEYKLIEARVKELESALKGEAAGNLVRREEVEYYYQVVVGRAHRALEDKEATLLDPRESRPKTIKRWDAIEKSSITIKGVTNPVSVKSIVFTKLSGLFTKKKDVVVEYALLSHFTETVSKEFDSQPIDLAEFVALLRERIEDAEREGYYYILIVISPTGFTRSLVNYITGEGVQWISIASKYTTIYLVDLIKGRVYHNPYDPVAKHNKFLANLELREEQVERVVNYMQSREARLEAIKKNPTVHYLSIDDVKAATAVDDILVLRRALSILEERGVGRVKKISNQLVFEYGSI